jgi:hypothetical protein
VVCFTFVLFFFKFTINYIKNIYLSKQIPTFIFLHVILSHQCLFTFWRRFSVFHTQIFSIKIPPSHVCCQVKNTMKIPKILRKFFTTHHTQIHVFSKFFLFLIFVEFSSILNFSPKLNLLIFPFTKISFLHHRIK